jgi:trans-aconitate methyltransferase
MTADKILTGLREAHDRLANAGYDVRVILTKDEHTVEGQVFEALKDKSYDVIVVGAGLRILPTMAAQFERLMNVLHQQAPTAKLAFNSMPDDSDAAALRWL